MSTRILLEFHDFSFSLAPVEADARFFAAPGAVLAPSNRAPKLSFADCFLASPATGASSPRRTRRLRPKGLSTFRMLAADQDAPLAETRIGLASGLRGDLRHPPERPRTPSGAAGGGAAQKARKKRTAWKLRKRRGGPSAELSDTGRTVEYRPRPKAEPPKAVARGVRNLPCADRQGQSRRSGREKDYYTSRNRSQPMFIALRFAFELKKS